MGCAGSHSQTRVLADLALRLPFAVLQPHQAAVHQGQQARLGAREPTPAANMLEHELDMHADKSLLVDCYINSSQPPTLFYPQLDLNQQTQRLDFASAVFTTHHVIYCIQTS